MIETDTGWESLIKFFGCFDAHAPSERYTNGKAVCVHALCRHSELLRGMDTGRSNKHPMS